MSAKLWYKLSDQWGRTYGGMQWGEGVSNVAVGTGRVFCTRDLIHLYSDPVVAMMHNPIHANYLNPMMWVAKTRGRVYNDRGLKYGSKSVTTLYQIPVPEITTEMRIAYAILCTKEVYAEEMWNAWATAWLLGADRTIDAACAAAARTNYAGNHAANYAACAAARSPGAHYATSAYTAAHAVNCAANAVSGKLGIPLDFPRLAEQALANEKEKK